jgi:hypothetical protein
MDLIQKIKSYVVRNTLCKGLGHNAEPAGNCPYTGVTYDYCKRCSYMIPREYVD